MEKEGALRLINIIIFLNIVHILSFKNKEAKPKKEKYKKIK